MGPRSRAVKGQVLSEGGRERPSKQGSSSSSCCEALVNAGQGPGADTFDVTNDPALRVVTHLMVAPLRHATRVRK